MMIRIHRLVFSALMILMIISGCSTGKASKVPIETDQAPEDFLSRPRFNKPAGRPLGRVLLSWDMIESADGYEIQMSDSENFTRVEKNWTIKGYNLELPIAGGAVKWFRIRSFNNKTASSWSTELKVEEQSL